MAGIMNRTARQYNLKTMVGEGERRRRVIVRIAPGFNVVDDDHWKAFVDGKKVDPYVAQLKEEGSLDFGPKVDDLEMEQAPDTQAKSKSEPAPKKKKEEAK